MEIDVTGTTLPDLSVDAEQIKETRIKKDKRTGETILEKDKLEFTRTEWDQTTQKQVVRKAYYQVQDEFLSSTLIVGRQEHDYISCQRRQ
jgi:hypothetical protein